MNPSVFTNGADTPERPNHQTKPPIKGKLILWMVGIPKYQTSHPSPGRIRVRNGNTNKRYGFQHGFISWCEMDFVHPSRGGAKKRRGFPKTQQGALRNPRYPHLPVLGIPADSGGFPVAFPLKQLEMRDRYITQRFMCSGTNGPLLAACRALPSWSAEDVMHHGCFLSKRETGVYFSPGEKFVSTHRPHRQISPSARRSRMWKAQGLGPLVGRLWASKQHKSVSRAPNVPSG